MELSNPISITIINEQHCQVSNIRLFDPFYYNTTENNITIKGLDFYGEVLYSYSDIMAELGKKEIFIDKIFIQLIKGYKQCAFQTLLYYEEEMKNKQGLVPLPVDEYRSMYIFNRSLKAESKIILNMTAFSIINIYLKIKM